MRETSGAAELGKAVYGCRGNAGALPRTPFRELFEKSSLKTLKNFWEKKRSYFVCRGASRFRRRRADEAEGMRVGNKRRGRTRKGDLRLPEGVPGRRPGPRLGNFLKKVP